MTVERKELFTMSHGILHTCLDRVLVEANIVSVDVKEHVAVRNSNGTSDGQCIIDGAGDAPSSHKVIHEHIHCIGL